MEVGAIIGAIVALLGSIGASWFSSYTSRKNTSLTNSANRMLAERSNELNVEQWNRENTYNTPLAQMGRFENAGLNRALALTGVQSLAGNSPSLSSSVSPMVSPEVFTPNFDTASNLLSQQSQLDIQKKLADSQSNLFNSQSNAIDKKLPEEVKMIQGQLNQVNQTIEHMKSNMAYLSALTSKTHTENAQGFVDLAFSMESYADRLKMIENKRVISDGDIQFQVEWREKTLGQMEETIKLLKSQQGLNKAQKAYYDAMELNIKGETNLQTTKRNLWNSERYLNNELKRESTSRKTLNNANERNVWFNQELEKNKLILNGVDMLLDFHAQQTSNGIRAFQALSGAF